MNRFPLSLCRIGYELPESACASSWIENGQFILTCGNVLRRLLRLKIFTTAAKQQFIKLEVIIDPGPEYLALDEGVYLQVGSGARLNGHDRVILKPGIHGISSVIRMCRNKRLNEQNETVWTMRKNLLQEISDSFRRLHAGVYEVMAKKNRRNGSALISNLRVRSSAYAAGALSLTEEQRLEKYINEWTSRSLRTEPLDRVRVAKAIDYLYSTFGLKPPRIVIAPSPLVMVIAGSFATALSYANDAPGAIATNTSENKAFAQVIT